MDVSRGPRVLLLSAVGTRVNPYLGLLHDGLAAAGADVRVSGELAAESWRPDVVHLHWLDRYDLPRPLRFEGVRPGLLRRLLVRGGNAPPVYALRRRARLARLFRELAAFQRAGGVVACTVHNLDPHEKASSAEQWGSARLLRLADVVHVHDERTVAELAARYGRSAGVAVIPHGHYIGSYPNTLSRAEARDRLGLPADAFVYACIGLLRPYKGLEELIPAFRSLPGAHLRLLLAGKPGTPEYGAALAALAAGDARIRLDPQFVPPEEIQVYYNAADICVLPYREITTSGAALLAFSFGLPIIAPAIGAFPNLVTPARGVLYDPAQPAGLTVALMVAQQHDWQAARPEILAWVSRFDWREIGARLLAAYTAAGA